MSEPANSPTAEKPAPGRVRRWLWRWTRRALITLGVLVAMLVVLLMLMSVFYRVENKKGNEAWAACQADLLQKGEKLDVAAFLPAPVPDEQNFAAAPLLVALFDPSRRDEVSKLEPKASLNDEFSNYPAQNWLKGQRTDLAAWQTYYRSVTNSTSLTQGTNAAETVLRVLGRFDATFKELREYGARPKTQFHFNYDPQKPFNSPFQYFTFVKNSVTTLGLHAQALLSVGRVEEAGQDVDLMFRLADSLKGERFLITLLVRRALLAITCKAIWNGLIDHHWTDAQLRRWQIALSEVDCTGEFLTSMRGERAGGIQYINLMASDPELLQKELSQSPLFDGRESNIPPSAAKGLPWLMPRGWIRMEQVNYALGFQNYILGPLSDRSNKPQSSVLSLREVSQVFNGISDESPFAQKLLDHRLIYFQTFPEFRNVFLKTAYSQSFLQMAATACALERHWLAKGAYPMTLDALAPDIQKDFAGPGSHPEVLRYHPTGDGRYLLYSDGWNGVDDGGKVVMDQDGIMDYKQGDWVWPQPAESAPKAGK